MRKVIQILVIGLISFLISELGLRIFHRYYPTPIFYNKLDQRWRGQPFAQDYDFTLNSLGFKDVEYPVEKPPNTFRGIGIGDSFFFGIVPYKANFLTLLEDSLQTDHTVEMINMGVPGTDPQNYVSLLLNEGLRFDPDLVLVGFFVGNDIQGNMGKTYNHSFVLTLLQYAFTLHREFKGRIYHRAPYQDDAPTFSNERYLYIETDRSRIYVSGNRLRDWVVDHATAEAIAHMTHIKRICNERGIDLVVVIIPDEVQINSELQQDVAQNMGRPLQDFNFMLPNQVIGRAFDEADIAYLDLLPLFLEASAQKRLYKPNDTHWNIAGNALAASAIATYLRQRYAWH